MTNSHDNLAKLATYLEALPDDYPSFDMLEYFTGPEHALYRYLEAPHQGLPPGACGCAIGHGPAALGEPLPDFYSWSEYVWHTFHAPPGSRKFVWMFHPDWRRVDNTPAGAAKRLRQYLSDGIPAGFVRPNP